jgi:hypothetical protein
MKQFLYLVMVATLITACKRSEPNDKVQEISKEGAIETSFTTKHLTDSLDVLVSVHKVWKNNSLVKTIETYDTVPALGITTIQNDNGTDQKVKKDYEIYITIK